MLQHVPFRFRGFPLLKLGNFVSDSGYFYFTLHRLLLPLTQEQQPDIFEILSKRYHRKSTVFCSQYKEEGWYQQLGGSDAPLTDGILDRIVHDAYRIDIEPVDPTKDISMREVYGLHK